MEKRKVIFFGTPEFAVPSLKELVDDENFNVVAVVTQKDKKIGREQKVCPPPIKKEAENLGIWVRQPDKVSDIDKLLRRLSPDICVVVAYGKIIPKDILEIPKYGFINVHGSILPRYRGASVIQAPILNGDTETGVTIMKMDEGLDTGPIISIGKIALQGDETAGQLHDKLARMGSRMLCKTLSDYIEGYLEPKPQTGKSTYLRQLKREDGRIDWRAKAGDIEKQIRAFTPWPGTFTTIKGGKTLKILEADNKVLEKMKGHNVGEVISRSQGAAVQTGSGGLMIKKLQLEGKKPMDIAQFLRGHKDFIGTILT